MILLSQKFRVKNTKSLTLTTNRTNTPKTTTSTTSPLKRTSSHSRTISSHKNHREMPTTIGQITTVAKEDLQAGQRFNKQGTRFNYWKHNLTKTLMTQILRILTKNHKFISREVKNSMDTPNKITKIIITFKIRISISRFNSRKNSQLLTRQICIRMLTQITGESLNLSSITIMKKRRRQDIKPEPPWLIMKITSNKAIIREVENRLEGIK